MQVVPQVLFVSLLFLFHPDTAVFSVEQKNRVSVVAHDFQTDLRLIISTDKQKYDLTDTIEITVTVENTGDYSPGIGGSLGVRYRITCDGKLVEDGSTMPPGDYGMDMSTLLAAHQVITHTYKINRHYLKEKFQKPGRYTIQISWPTGRKENGEIWDPNPHQNLISNVVEFEILAPGGTTENGTQQPFTPPQAGGSQQTPAAQSTAWPWYTYPLIALGVLIIGGAAYFILSKRKK
jgi:hypothetical protein